jgi:hypothetical protein
MKSSNDLNLLLSAVKGGDHELVHLLLEKGVPTTEDTKIWPGFKPMPAKGSAWMIALLFYAGSSISRWGSHDFERCSLAVEQFLKFGADENASFVVRERPSSQDPAGKLIFIPLQQLIRIKKPLNFDSLQNLLLERAKGQLRSKATCFISKLTPWTGDTILIH